MKLLKFLLIISIFGLVSCSNNKKKKAKMKNDSSVTQIEGESDFIIDSDEEDLELSSDQGTDTSLVFEEEGITEIESASRPQVSFSDGSGEYIVERGDTLMLIAFKIYGDYRQWKALKRLNPSVGMGRLAKGTSVKYQEPMEKFVWNPAGLPYLIRNGDSLVSISKNKYGTTSKWRHLYDNNRPMIHDPNLIFAGFTLYYVPNRDVASE